MEQILLVDGYNVIGAWPELSFLKIVIWKRQEISLLNGWRNIKVIQDIGLWSFLMHSLSGREEEKQEISSRSRFYA